MKITREELIEHCERQITLNKTYPKYYSKRVFEHKIFLELLTGKSINEIFDENDEYIDNEK